MDQNKIQELQMLENNLQNLMMQKHSLQSQVLELDSAIEELKNSSESFKIIGNFIIKQDPKELRKDLISKNEISNKRLGTIEKQEEDLRKEFQNLQKEVLESERKNRK